MMSKIDEDDLREWKRHPITQKVYSQILEGYNPDSWRFCELGKLEYHKGTADLMDKIRYFLDENKTSNKE